MQLTVGLYGGKSKEECCGNMTGGPRVAVSRYSGVLCDLEQQRQRHRLRSNDHFKMTVQSSMLVDNTLPVWRLAPPASWRNLDFSP